MNERGVAAALSGIFVFMSSMPAAAQGRVHPAVTLEVDPCVAADSTEVRRIVGVELDALLATGDADDATRVHVVCEGALALIEVDDAVTGKMLLRRVDLSSAPPKGKPRLLALAIAELVSASWIELESNPEPRVAPATASSPEARAAVLGTLRERSHAAPPPPVSPAPTAASTWRALAVVAHRSVFADDGTSAWGLGARLAYDHGSGVGAVVDLVADRATNDEALGVVTVDTVSASAAAHLSRAWSPFAASVGLGIRAGFAHFSGDPRSPDRVRGDALTSAWGGPLVGASLRARVASAIAVELSGEAGYAVVPVSGLVDGVREVSIRGVWLGAQLGAGIFF